MIFSSAITSCYHSSQEDLLLFCLMSCYFPFMDTFAQVQIQSHLCPLIIGKEVNVGTRIGIRVNISPLKQSMGNRIKVCLSSN